MKLLESQWTLKMYIGMGLEFASVTFIEKMNVRVINSINFNRIKKANSSPFVGSFLGESITNYNKLLR